MTETKITKKDIGKRVTFRALRKWSNAKATRIITDVTENDTICVNFEGCRPFYVFQHEVIKLHRHETKFRKTSTNQQIHQNKRD